MEEKKKEILSAGGIWLETERMILRDHRWEDLESHHGLISDPDAMYYLPEILTHNLEESRMDLESSIEAIGKPDRREYFLRMEDKETGELIGETGYTVMQEHPVGKMEHAGFISRRQFWGQGYLPEAFRAILRFTLNENNVCRLNTGRDPENKGSERVMIKCRLIRADP